MPLIKAGSQLGDIYSNQGKLPSKKQQMGAAYIKCALNQVALHHQVFNQEVCWVGVVSLYTANPGRSDNHIVWSLSRIKHLCGSLVGQVERGMSSQQQVMRSKN